MIILERIVVGQATAEAPKQTFGNIYSVGGSKHFVTLERSETPFKKISRLPSGTYSYKVVNKSPSCGLAHIIIKHPKKVIRVYDDYDDGSDNISIGKQVSNDGKYYNISEQRSALMELCSESPEEGTFVIIDEPTQ